MWIDPATCYQALVSRDVRFDGMFFVGVTSTGIYCQPIFRVRVPKRENCLFYPSAAAAEAAGFRPCLRCRPELAPESAPEYARKLAPEAAPEFARVDAASRLAHTAANLIENGMLTDAGQHDKHR